MVMKLEGANAVKQLIFLVKKTWIKSDDSLKAGTVSSQFVVPQ